MGLDELASTAFVLIRADASAVEAHNVVVGSDASRVIVDGGDDQHCYLLPIAEVRDLLGAASPDATVAECLALGRRPTTLVVDGSLPAVFAPPVAIVTRDGRIAGYIDSRGSHAKPPMAAETAAAPAEPSVVAPAAAEAATSRAEPPPSRSARRGPSPGVATRRSADGKPGPSKRSLEAEFPERVRVDSVAWLLVYITTQAATGHGLGLDVGPGEVIDVLVQPRAGFALEGDDDRGTLTVPASGESLPLQFKLKGVAEGPGEVRILAFHKGEPLGAITLEATVESAAAPHLRGGPAPAPRRSNRLAAPSPALPDLTMFVEEWQASGATQYRILLSAADPALDLNLRTFGPLALNLDPEQFFADFFKEIDDLPLDTDAQRDVADRRLAAKGAYLPTSCCPTACRRSCGRFATGSARSSCSRKSPGSPGSCASWSGGRTAGSSRVRSSARPIRSPAGSPAWGSSDR